MSILTIPRPEFCEVHYRASIYRFYGYQKWEVSRCVVAPQYFSINGIYILGAVLSAVAPYCEKETP